MKANGRPRRRPPVPVRAVAWAWRRHREARRQDEARAELVQVVTEVVAATSGDGSEAEGWEPERKREAVRVGRSLLHRHRRALYPVAVAAGLWAAARVAAQLDWMERLTAGLVVMAGLVAWMAACKKRTTATTLAALSGVVLPAVWWWGTAWGLLHPALSVAVGLPILIGAVTARAWHFRIRPAPPPPQWGPQEVWAETLAANGRVLAGSTAGPFAEATAPDGRVIGQTTEIRLVPGKQTAGHVAGAAHLIASAFDTEESNVLVDPVKGTLARARVTILNRDDESVLDGELLDDGTGLDPATGSYTHGLYVDHAPAVVPLVHPEHGSYPVWISGFRGTGKSGSGDTLIVKACRSGLFVPIIIDLKGGTSLRDHADSALIYAETSEDGLRVMRGMIALMRESERILKETRRADPVTGQDMGPAKVLPVTPGLPAPLLVIEESPVLWEEQPAAIDLARRLLTLSRAVQIGIVMMSQATTVKQAFGNDGALKEQFLAGTQIVHRNTKAAGDRMQSPLPVDPRAIPDETPGAGYLMAPGSRRDALMRTQWVKFPTLAASSMRIPELDERRREALLSHWRGAVNDPKPAARQSRGEAAARVRDAVVAEVARRGEVRTSDLYGVLAGVSDDQVDRALKAAAEAGLVVKADRGLWSARASEGVAP